MQKAIQMLAYQGTMIEQLADDLHCKGDRERDSNSSNEYHALAVMLSNHANAIAEISAIVEGVKRAA